MATAYTNLLGLALPVTGELSGTWGDVVNNSITELVEDSIAGTATAAVTSGDWTLTTTGSGAANQARCAILVPTGTPGVTRNIIAPSSSKAYVVVNQSNAAVVVKGAATTGTTVLAGRKSLVAWNGIDFVTVGSGDVEGPASSTTNAFARFSDTTGKAIKDAANASLDDSGNATFAQVNIPAQGTLRIEDSAGGQYVGFQAPATVSASYTLVFPADDGSANQVLKTNGSGILSWADQTTFSYPSAGIAVSTGSAWGTSKSSPTGDIVGTSDTQTLSNKVLTTPTITGGKETKVDMGANNIDLTAGNYFTKTISGATTLTVSNVPTTGNAASFILDLTNGGSATITWWSGMKWAGGTAPTLTASGRDALGFYTYDGGTTWTGLVLGKDIK